MKKYLILLLVLCFAALPALADTDRVVDEANLLSSYDEIQLQERIDAIRDTYHMDVAIVIKNSIGFQPINVYVADYYVNAGYGVGETKDGIIFLIDMRNGEFFSATHGKEITRLDNTFLDALHQEIVPLLSEGAFGEACLTYVNGIDKQLANEYTPVSTVEAVGTPETENPIPVLLGSIFPVLPFLTLIVSIVGGVM